MLSEEEMEKKRTEQAVSNILRGIDIESSALILEKTILDNYIITGGRVNILHLAVRQILYFIENSKIQNVGDKSILDYVKENIKLKEQVKQLENKLNEFAKVEQKVDSINFTIPIETIKNLIEIPNTDLDNENKRLKSREQKLIEKLEKDIVNITKTMQDGKHCDDYSRCRLKAYRTKTKEILEILKKE